MIYLYKISRIFLFPVFRYILPLLSSRAKRRIDFELKNLTSISSLSKADLCFEFSSEGEFEQVKYLVDYCLEQGLKVELLYCSDSVENQCQKLQSKWPSSIRSFRLPILTYNPLSKEQNISHWITAQTIFLCRYDFFPELVFLKKKKIILIAATMLAFETKKFLVQKYLLRCYKSFYKIITNTRADANHLSKIVFNKTIKVCDFRTLQIEDRQSSAEETLRLKIPLFDSFSRHLKSADQRIIFGNLWAYELDIFDSMTGRDLCGRSLMLVPHNLGPSEIEKISHCFLSKGVKTLVINTKTTEAEMKQMITDAGRGSVVWILNMKGILCELYRLYDLAYIGGGFNKSVHSLLEPFLAGNSICFGPVIGRSTEFITAQELAPKRVCKLMDKSQVWESMLQNNYINKQFETKIDSRDVQNIIDWLELDKGFKDA